MDTGTLGFLCIPSLDPANATARPTPGKEEAALLFWAECISPNRLTVGIDREGSYDLVFGNCRLTHLPSGQSSQPLRVKRAPVLVTKDDIDAQDLTVFIPEESLYKIVLFRDGAPEPNARVFLAQDPNTFDVRADATGAIALLDDPRELVAIAFDKKLKASLFCWGKSGSGSLLAAIDPFPNPLPFDPEDSSTAADEHG